jgi:hypothetical protein
MIPLLVTVGYRPAGRRWRRLYIPFPLVLLVLSPLLLLAVIGGLIACRIIFDLRPMGALRGAGQLLWALPGTRVEIADGQMDLLLRVR